MKHKKDCYIILLLMLILAFSNIFFKIPDVEATLTYENFTAYQKTEGRISNHTNFWKLLNAYSNWNLEYNNGSGWNNIKSDLQIIKDRVGSICKITLNFTASFNADYRLTFGINLNVKNYFHKEGSWNYTLTYKNYTAIFDWSDLKNITGLIVSHGTKPINNELWFWFRVRKNNVSEGKNIVIDPILEDFTDYEVEGSNTEFISDYELKANPYDRDIDEYVYSDEGAGYFGDFEHIFDTFWNASSHNSASVLYFCVLSNDLDDGYNLLNGIGIRAEEFNSKVKYYLFEVGGSSDSTDWINYHIWYYCIISRVDTTLTLEIYSSYCLRELGGSGDVDTLTITVATTTYRYIYPISSHNTGHSARDAYGNIRNLDLQRDPTEFLTFYHNSGGIFKVDGVTVANGSEIGYFNETIIELVGVVEGNLTYGFNNFTWNGNNDISNPYNLTIISNLTIWCYFDTITCVSNGINYSVFSYIGINSTLNGSICEFRINWTDADGLDGFYFSTNNTGTWINGSYTSMSGTEDIAVYTTTLNDTVGLKVEWLMYGNNSLNEWTESNTYFFTVNDPFKAVIVDVSIIAVFIILTILCVFVSIFVFIILKKK